MALHDELLELAETLSGSDNPARARRSISTAYYALFHRLAFEAALLFFPQPSDAPLHAATVRALDHGNMKRVCQWFSGAATYNKQVAGFLRETEVPESLVEVSRAFAKLQEDRHDADYNIALDLTGVEARNCCAQARMAFNCLDEGHVTPVFRLFLGCLLFANAWRSPA